MNLDNKLFLMHMKSNIVWYSLWFIDISNKIQFFI